MINEVPYVSIVVPVYNSEKYIERCINSLINQTISNIEIIIVNDGSTDDSLDIINKYCSLDKRIKLINKNNTGVSDSRNIGIENSTGDYITFVDSDDWIDSNYIEIMYNQALFNKCEIVMCSYIREFADHSKERKLNLQSDFLYKKDDINLLNRKLIGPTDSELKNPEGLDSLGTVWGKLYKSELIKENNIKFIDLDKIGSAEDTLFNIYLFNKVNSLYFTDQTYYHYWKENENSITSNYNPKLKEQWINLFLYIQKFIDDNDKNSDFKEALKNRICTSILGLGLNECNKNNNLSFHSKVKNIKSLLNDELFVSNYKDFNIKEFPIHWKFFYCLAKNRKAYLLYVMLNIIEFLRKNI